LLMLLLCYLTLFFCGCLPKGLDYYTTYLCRDCYGRSRDEEEPAPDVPENHLGQYGYGQVLPDGRDANQYEYVNPDETRKNLKLTYEKAKDTLVGKQLSCISASEELYSKVRKWVQLNQDLMNKPRKEDDPGPEYTDLRLIMDELKLNMTAEELDPNHDPLASFRLCLSNHLVMHFEKDNEAMKQEAISRLCLCGDMKWEDAEQQVNASFKLKFKVLANDLCQEVTDDASKKRAVQKIAAQGATWYNAAKFMDEAMNGQHKDKAEILGSRDYGIETIPINRSRRKKYIKLKEWWEAHLAAYEQQMSQNPLTRNLINETPGIEVRKGLMSDMVGALPEALVGRQISFLDDYCVFKPYLSLLTQQYEELRNLTDHYIDVQQRWAVYLKLCNSAAHVDNGKNKRLLRQQVRHEMIAALGGLIVDTTEMEDRDEIHKLLQEMESVDIQTDEYVHRLEDNLREIYEMEHEQVEDIKVQLEVQQKVMSRMDNVNSGLKKNIEQLARIMRTQQKIRCCGYLSMALTVAAVVFILFQDQIF